jgi:hypothetical protein
MTFMKVNEVLQHRGGDGVDQGILFGDLHSSRTTDDSADPAIDPFIGIPVMDSVPDRDYSRTLWHGYQLCAPVQQAVFAKAWLCYPCPDSQASLCVWHGSLLMTSQVWGQVSPFEQPKSAANLECY